MAGGWWRSTLTNLDAGSPANLAVSVPPNLAPRGHDKLVSIATGAGLYLTGTPSVTVGGELYYADDTYTIDVGKPRLVKWNGSLNTVVLTIPDVGVTPAKAILSMVADANDNIYISTWDSGTSATTFAGRVFKYTTASGTIVAFGDNVFSGGRLPLSLAIDTTTLYVGATRQDPTKHASIWSIDLGLGTTAPAYILSDTVIAGATISSVVRTTATTTYKITAVDAYSQESGGSSEISVVTNPELDASTYNSLTWTARTGASTYNIYRTAGHTSTGKLAGTAGVTYTDNGVAGNSASVPTAPATAVSPLVEGGYLGGGGGVNTDYQYVATLTRDGITSEAVYGNVFLGSSIQGPGFNNTNIDVTVNFYDALTTIKVYRIQGPGTKGLTHTVTMLPNLSGNVVNFYDNVTNGDGTDPPKAPVAPTPSFSANVDPTTTTTYKVTSVTATGESIAGSTSSVAAKATLSTNSKVTPSWSAVSGASTYNVYRTAGHTSTGKIGNTASLTLADTGLSGDSTTAPLENTSGTPIGGVAALSVYSSKLYAALYNDAGIFGTVQLCDGGVIADSDVAASGTSRAYNGYTALAVFGSNLYAAYWNNDTTPYMLVRKFDGTTWSTVLTINTSSARPILAFAKTSTTLYMIGGGDASNTMLYQTTDGTTWKLLTTYVPTSKEGSPIIGIVGVPGGF